MNTHVEVLKMQEVSCQGCSGLVLGVWLAVMILCVVSLWRVFVKAGQPGWGILIPIYNAYLFLKVAGRPGWWLILLFIPVVNFVISIVVTFDIARRFGKGVGFGLGLLFLGIIFYPILAFGDARYQPGPSF